jgi:hypothetical protein
MHDICSPICNDLKRTTVVGNGIQKLLILTNMNKTVKIPSKYNLD